MDEVSDTSTIVVNTVNERALGVQGDRAEFIRDKVTPISTGKAGSRGGGEDHDDGGGEGRERGGQPQ